MKYDLAVIGGGAAGYQAAFAATKLNQRVALVERERRRSRKGDFPAQSISAKSLREAISQLAGIAGPGNIGTQFRKERSITIGDIRAKIAQITQHEMDVVHDQLERDGVDIYMGEAQFLGSHLLEVRQQQAVTQIEAEKIIIATGTRPERPAYIPFDGRYVVDLNEVLQLPELPTSMIVVGGETVGIEYALLLAAVGVEVTIVAEKASLFGFCDRDIVDELLRHARSFGVTLHFGQEAVNIQRSVDGGVIVDLQGGERLTAETLLFNGDRVGNTDTLNLPAAGLEPDEHGRLWCNDDQQTWQKHIYAAGDVAGFPAWAAVVLDQGRRAVSNAFGMESEFATEKVTALMTVPEVMMVGKSEQQLVAEGVPFAVGGARFRETARGRIYGEQQGMLKLLFHRETLEILGVHCIGETAGELIGIGQAALAGGRTVEYFRDTVLNYPNTAEYYSVAAFDGLNKQWRESAVEARDLVETSVG